jgi:steroid Delta-isomerase
MPTGQTDRLPNAVRAFWENTERLDVEQWLATFAPEADSEDPVGTGVLTDNAGRRAFFEGLKAGFRRVSFDLHHVETAGPWVAVAWKGVAVNTSDVALDFSGIDVFQLGGDDERIVHQRGYWDPSRLAG